MKSCWTVLAALWTGLTAAAIPPCPDLVRPEGKTRWDLTRCDLPHLDRAGGRLHVITTPGDAAERWLHPERFLEQLVPGFRGTQWLDEVRDGTRHRLWIRRAIVGAGWLHLPDGPRAAVLEEALVLRGPADGRGFVPDRLVHRWLDGEAGVLAEVWGPVAADGRSRETIAGAAVRDDPPSRLVPLTKLYDGQVMAGVKGGINFGWDRGKNVAVSALTVPSYADAGALVDASVWDFSQNGERHAIAGTTTANATTTIVGAGTAFQSALVVGDRISLSSSPGTYARVTNIASNTQLTLSGPLGNGTTQSILRRSAEVVSTAVEVSTEETCNAANCGYTVPGGVMDREDRNIDDPATFAKTNAVSERVETPGASVTYWLRAGSQNEGRAGSFGSGESKFCYLTTGPTVRTPVPLWRFAHQDAEGYFLQIGDTWSSAPFGCEQNIFNQVCTDNCGFACALYSSACAGHSGTQNGEVLKAGVVVLPSGHTLNALLIRTVADFCVYLTGSCGTPLSQVRTVVHLWQVPYLGTVVRLQSPQNAPADLRSYAILDGTNIAFGLFPPRTIQATGSTSGTVSLTWDPGLDTRRITGYRVHWDTDSGSVSDYAFNSETHPGQVSLVGTTATVSGLQPGTGYFFTVTALSTFTDPSSGEITTYESERYPTQIAGDPSFVYPVEVQATTGGGTCTPVEEVGGLRVNKAAGGNIELCWTPVSDPCAVGYQVLGAPSPASPGGFVPLADTGLETCWIGSPSASYFVVAARGTGGVGPWGHFGR